MRHSKLIVKKQNPLNAEPPLEALRGSFITPTEAFYIRDHGSIPRTDPEQYRLTVGGKVKKPLSLSLDDLRRDFPKCTLTATLQCAGNRREELSEVEEAEGVQWEEGAIGTAQWGGAELRAVLRAAGGDESAGHVAFAAFDAVEKEGRRFGFGGSIPMAKALAPEVLLAWEMNGAPLPHEHGHPLRVVVPGYIGARSVKWLSRISVQDQPSDNYFQRHAYKLFPPDVDEDNVRWEQGMMLGELPVNAAICNPLEGEAVAAGTLRVQGYAIAGGGRTVERVDLSADGGRSWTAAALTGGQDSPWAWTLWEAALEVRPGDLELVVRAWDSAAQTQPEDPEQVWNFKGYLNNAWHRVRVRVR